MWVLGIELGKHAFLTAEIFNNAYYSHNAPKRDNPSCLSRMGRKRRRPSQWSVISKLKKRKSLAARRKPWRRKLRSTLGPPQSAAHAGCWVRQLTDSGPLRGVAGGVAPGRLLSQAAPRARRQFGHVPGHVAPAPAIFRRFLSQGLSPRPESLPSLGAAAPTAAAMNIFRLTGDLSHLAAIVILLLKIWKTRSCAGERSPGRGARGRTARKDPFGPRSLGGSRGARDGRTHPPRPAQRALKALRVCTRVGVSVAVLGPRSALGPPANLIRPGAER